MGLDMYLTKKRKSLNNEVKKTEIGYWRRANQIFKAFIDINEDALECNKIEVTLEQLIEIRNLCKQVLQDNSLAEKLLPPLKGFFFRTYDFDEWYFEELKNTITIIDYIKLMHWHDDKYIFQASW